MSAWPIAHAMIEFTISGKSVPIDTSTRPITSGEILNAEAIAAQPVTVTATDTGQVVGEKAELERYRTKIIQAFKAPGLFSHAVRRRQ